MMEAQKPFQILVVDDEPPICELLTRVAKDIFPEASFVNTRSPQETLDNIDARLYAPPQLILLDIDLGSSISGLDLIPELISRLQGQTPIIILSNLSEDSKIHKAYERGAVAYTEKPYDLQGWQAYVTRLRSYWHGTSLLPTTAKP
ncbi:response regulator [Spirosoma pomorum]